MNSEKLWRTWMYWTGRLKQLLDKYSNKAGPLQMTFCKKIEVWMKNSEVYFIVGVLIIFFVFPPENREDKYIFTKEVLERQQLTLGDLHEQRAAP